MSMAYMNDAFYYVVMQYCKMCKYASNERLASLDVTWRIKLFGRHYRVGALVI